MTIIFALFALGVLIFFHELGHYLAARKVGVHVEEFSVGFPPRLFSRVSKGTRFSLSLIFLGGFVKLKGQNIEDEDKSDPSNYASKTVWERFQIIFAGPLVNMLLPFLIMPFAFLWGSNEPIFLHSPAIVEQVAENSLAEKQGIGPGDRIVEVNGYPTETWKDVFENLGKPQSDKIELYFRSEGKVRSAAFAISDFSQGLGWSPRIPPIVGTVVENTPAASMGLKYGDRIVSIDDKAVNAWGDIAAALGNNGEAAGLEPKNHGIVIDRAGKRLSFDFMPSIDGASGRKVIGITAPYVEQKHGLLDAIRLGFASSLDMFVEILRFFDLLFAGAVDQNSVGGPVMITSIIGQAAQTGLFDFLKILSLLSVNLGILNLLPFPVLDGGHLLFLLIEKIKGSELSAKFRQLAQSLGAAILFGFLIYITFLDSLRMFF